MDAWFTEEGATGELEIERRNESWFVTSPPDDAEFKCIIEDEDLVESSSSKQRIEATVSKFRQGMDGRASYLFLTTPSGEQNNAERNTGKEDRSRNSLDQNRGSRNTRSSSNETWELKQFRGSGEYVNVEATIDTVYYIKKDTRGVPDIKGELTDDSVLQPVKFIVQDGVDHPYLGEGNRFLFESVKDHHYTKENEVQVVINEYTGFTEIE